MMKKGNDLSHELKNMRAPEIKFFLRGFLCKRFLGKVIQFIKNNFIFLIETKKMDSQIFYAKIEFLKVNQIFSSTSHLKSQKKSTQPFFDLLTP
jgi:hypothetical protein